MKQLFTFLIVTAIFLSSKAQTKDQLSKEEKVYGLSKFWQEVNYNFAFLDKIDRNAWDSLYLKMIKDVQLTSSDYEYYHLLEKFCAFLKDGHTNIFFPERINPFLTSFGEYRFYIQYIDGKAIISQVNKSKKEDLPPGSEIIEVNGNQTKDYINQVVMPYVSASTSQAANMMAYFYLLRGEEGSIFKIQVKLPSGHLKEFTLRHQSSNENNFYPDIKYSIFDFKWYPNQVAYILLNSFADVKIDSLFDAKLPELKKAKAIILDLRTNGGGSTEIGTYILRYLTRDTFLYGARSATPLHIAAYQAYGKYLQPKDTVGNEEYKNFYLNYLHKSYLSLNDKPQKVAEHSTTIVVPTALLIGPNTVSAAEDFLIYADNQKHMIKIGETTNGSTGMPLFISLPGGGSARICTKHDTYPDGREFVGIGIKPDIEIKRTLTDYLKNNDPVLNKALQVLSNKMK